MNRAYDQVIKRWAHPRVSEAWKDEASCRGTDPGMWFPADQRNRSIGRSDRDPVVKNLTRMAKLICAECPVRRECLTWALVVDERYGIYGGLTPRERSRITGKRAL